MEPIPNSVTLHSVSVDLTDESDWSEALRGDGEAFGRIFDRHRARVTRHCRRLVDVPVDADDLVSVVFLEAWRHRRSLRFVDGSLLPWLLVTATNSARNLARKTRRYREVLEGIPPKIHEGTDPADRHDSDAQEALKRLSINDQRVISLCILEGFSEKDAAQAQASA